MIVIIIIIVITTLLNRPWAEGIADAEALVQACSDPKLLPDLQAKLSALQQALTIDFDRILTGKTDFRSFTVRNTCHLPVAWDIVLGDFADSPNIVISPSQGVIAVGATVTIMVTFSSRDPVMVNGKFSLRYSDAEGGLDSSTRVGTKQLKVVAEAYVITTVSLTAEGQEEGGNEIDFGNALINCFY